MVEIKVGCPLKSYNARTRSSLKVKIQHSTCALDGKTAAKAGKSIYIKMSLVIKFDNYNSLILFSNVCNRNRKELRIDRFVPTHNNSAMLLFRTLLPKPLHIKDIFVKCDKCMTVY